MPLLSLCRRLWTRAIAGSSAAVLIGCAPMPAPVPPAGPGPGPAPAPGAAPAAVPRPPAPRESAAGTQREYRRDAAAHLYALNAERIYAGKLQPMLYAIGVLEVDVDREGQIRRLHWLRMPHHAPEVVREIERTVRAAAPFPRPNRLGRVTYVETWLWDKSGRFQLDTLSEGQL